MIMLNLSFQVMFFTYRRRINEKKVEERHSLFGYKLTVIN